MNVRGAPAIAIAAALALAVESNDMKVPRKHSVQLMFFSNGMIDPDLFSNGLFDPCSGEVRKCN
jgi:hypothetical protein